MNLPTNIIQTFLKSLNLGFICHTICKSLNLFKNLKKEKQIEIKEKKIKEINKEIDEICKEGTLSELLDVSKKIGKEN